MLVGQNEHFLRTHLKLPPCYTGVPGCCPASVAFHDNIQAPPGEYHSCSPIIRLRSNHNSSYLVDTDIFTSVLSSIPSVHRVLTASLRDISERRAHNPFNVGGYPAQVPMLSKTPYGMGGMQRSCRDCSSRAVPSMRSLTL